MKRILVTGGWGFIGSHTVVRLQQVGFEVVIIDNLSNPALFILDRIRSTTGKQLEWSVTLGLEEMVTSAWRWKKQISETQKTRQ